MQTRAVAAWLAISAVLISACGSGSASRGGFTAQSHGGSPSPGRTASSGAAGTTSATGRRHPGRGRGRAAGSQLIVVTAPSYGATYAALTAYQRVRGRWLRVFGPWTARIGKEGMAPPHAKREGDGRTPSGTYGLGFMFGALPNPGVAFRYRQAYPYDMWDDDSSSALYNEWVDTRYHDPGASPEPMDVSGYDYGVVIGYNTARTPGLGSAIFLHVNIGTATTGCVTLPMDRLLKVLRWLRPARSPWLELGVDLAPPGGS